MQYSKEKPKRSLKPIDEDLVMMIPFYILVAILILVFCSMYLSK